MRKLGTFVRPRRLTALAGVTAVAVGLASAASSGAAPWTAPRALCESCGFNPAAEVQMAASGGAVVAWTTRSQRSVAYRAPDGSLSTLALSSGRQDRGQPTTVGIGDDGLAVAAWSDGASVRAVVREPGGRWSAPEVIGSGGQPDAAVTAGGTIYVAIAAAASRAGIQVARRAPGGGWTLQRVPSGPIGHVPEIAAAGAYVIVAWRDGVAHGRRVLSSTLRDGAWQAAEPLPVPPDTFTVPALAVDHHGNALAVSRERGTAVGTSVHASHRPALGPWSAPERLGDGPTAELPQVAFDRAGNALVAWRGTTPDGPPAVRVARFNGAEDDWRGPVDVARARLRGAPALGVGAAGHALVGWIGAGPRAAQGSALSGLFDQPEPIREGAGHPSPAGLIDVGVDRRGRAVAVWQERRLPNNDSLYLSARSADGAGEIRLSAAQLLINQRISQAAIRRLNSLTAAVDAAPPPEPGLGGTPAAVDLSAAQLRINQRISQAAVRRANELAGRLEGRLPGPAQAPEGGDRITLSARQLLINQRISQAAVRRANALAERIPETPFPPPDLSSPALTRLVGLLETADRGVMTVQIVERRGTLGDGGPIAVGDRVPVVFAGPPRPSFEAQSEIVAIGVLHEGVMYAPHYSIEDPF